MKKSKRRKARGRDVLKLIVGTMFGLISIWIHVAVFSMLLNAFYRVTGWAPPRLLDFSLVFIVSGLVIALEGKILIRFRPPGRRDPFFVFAEAFVKIARGEYDLDLDLHDRHGHFDRLVGGLHEMTDSLRQAEEMRQRFISDMSHEIQSPLTSIRGFARILREEELEPDKWKGYLGIIEEESLRLSRLSEDLLEMTKLESSGPKLDLTEYRLDRQLRDVVLNYEPQWRQKGILVTADLAEEIILAEKDLLMRVWNNLFHNAVKFTPSGKNISLSLFREGESLIVSVADEGAGIAEEELPRIFDRFHKTDKSRSHKGSDSGSGLGLSIVKRIVTIHGGEVRVTSEGSGKGAIFRVVLPVSANH